MVNFLMVLWTDTEGEIFHYQSFKLKEFLVAEFDYTEFKTRRVS